MSHVRLHVGGDMEFTSLGATQPSITPGSSATPGVASSPVTGQPQSSPRATTSGAAVGITTPSRGSGTYGLSSSSPLAAAPSSPLARSEFKGIRTDGPFEKSSNVAVDMAADPWSSDARISTMPHHAPREYVQCLRWPMFWYPYQVNTKVIRLSSLFAAIIAVIGIILRTNRSMQYTIFALSADYALKFIFGDNTSLTGVFSQLLLLLTGTSTTYWADFVEGPPQQFGALVHGILASVASILFWHADGSDQTGASVLLAVLMASSLLEAIFGWSVPPTLFRKFEDSCMCCREDGFTNPDRLKPKPPRSSGPSVKGLGEIIVRNVGKEGERRVPFRYRKTNDTYKANQFHLIKQMSISYFNLPLGIAGLAAAWKLATSTNNCGKATSSTYNYCLLSPASLWQLCAIIAAIMFGQFFVFYLFKIIEFPSKVTTEWNHPQSRPLFALPLTTILLFSYLATDDYLVFAKVLFWIAAPLSLFNAVIAVTSWIKHPQSSESFDSARLWPMVSCLVAAWVAPALDSDWTEPAWLWWSFGLFFWFVFFTMNMSRLLFNATLLDNLRPSLFLFFACPALACSSYVTITGTTFDAFAKFLYYLTIGIFFIITWLVVVNYFQRTPFDMNAWTYLFPLTTIAITSIQYHQQVGAVNLTATSEFLATFWLVLANGVALILSAHFFLALFRKRIFVPSEKNYPLQLLAVINATLRDNVAGVAMASHDAGTKHTKIRAASEKAGVRVIPTDSAKRDELVSLINDRDRYLDKFFQGLHEVLFAYTAHVGHLKTCVYPAYAAWWPNAIPAPVKEHEELVREAEQLEYLIRDHIATPATFKVADLEQQVQLPEGTYASLFVLREQRYFRMRELTSGEEKTLGRFDKWRRAVITVTDKEDFHLGPIGRKYLSIDQQKDIVRSIWSSHYAEEWARFIPWLIKSVESPVQRLQALRALRWALPDRMQLIGKWLYERTDDLTWRLLTADVPELVPRHIPGWIRYY